MADIMSYTPKKNKSWLNQYAATSGQMPSADAIDQMIQSELDAAYRNRYASGALALQGKRDQWDKEKYASDLDFRNRELASRNKMNADTMSMYDKSRKSQEKIGWLGAGSTALGAALSYGLKPDAKTKTSPFGDLYTKGKGAVGDLFSTPEESKPLYPTWDKGDDGSAMYEPPATTNWWDKMFSGE